MQKLCHAIAGQTELDAIFYQHIPESVQSLSLVLYPRRISKFFLHPIL